jgi:hypothetical protein
MKMFLEVRTPGNGKVYEIKLDDKLSLSVVKAKIIDEITAFEGGQITLGHISELFSLASQTRIESTDISVREAGLRSGQVVLLL